MQIVGRFCLLSVAPAALVCAAPIQISEILFNPDGADRPHEYVELRGAPGASIAAGTYLVGLEGDVTAGETLGGIQTIFNLSGMTFGSNGFLLLLQNGNSFTPNSLAMVFTGTGNGFLGINGGPYSSDGSGPDIENASATWLLIQTGVAPLTSGDAGTNNDGFLDAELGSMVLDGIAVTDGNNAGDRGYASYCFNANDGGPSNIGTCNGATNLTANFTPSHVARLGIGTWFAADTDPSAQFGFIFEPNDVTGPRLANKPLSIMDQGGPNPVPKPSITLLTAAGPVAVAFASRRMR